MKVKCRVMFLESGEESIQFNLWYQRVLSGQLSNFSSQLRLIIAKLNIIISLCYKNYTHCNLCLLIYLAAIVLSLSFSFRDDFDQDSLSLPNRALQCRIYELSSPTWPKLHVWLQQMQPSALTISGRHRLLLLLILIIYCAQIRK